uniref:RRM domain-containing protein n=1 Tax=Castor canadensis TaxID=51338 RepID=A0A8C0X2R4_CASCN
MPRVYIGRLSYNVREKDIQRFFSGYGRLLEVDLKNGYGFVEFEDSRDADDAVYELNGKELCGERVIVEHARGPRRDRDGYSYGSRSESHPRALRVLGPGGRAQARGWAGWGLPARAGAGAEGGLTRVCPGPAAFTPARGSHGTHRSAGIGSGCLSWILGFGQVGRGWLLLPLVALSWVLLTLQVRGDCIC